MDVVRVMTALHSKKFRKSAYVNVWCFSETFQERPFISLQIKIKASLYICLDLMLNIYSRNVEGFFSLNVSEKQPTYTLFVNCIKCHSIQSAVHSNNLFLFLIMIACLLSMEFCVSFTFR